MTADARARVVAVDALEDWQRQALDALLGPDHNLARRAPLAVPRQAGRPRQTDMSVTLSVPPRDEHPVRWWHDLAIRQLRDVVRAAGRTGHGRARVDLVHGKAPTITATVATRPAKP